MRVEDPSFIVRMDDHHIIHVRPMGEWSLDIIERYWGKFLPFLYESRDRLGHAKALIDRRGVPIMSFDMVHSMSQGIARHYVSGDRLAMVVDSSPLKAQIRHTYRLEHLDAFLSYDSALAWLKNS